MEQFTKEVALARRFLPGRDDSRSAVWYTDTMLPARKQVEKTSRYMKGW